MRKFRTAAVATATALTMTFAGTSVASAEPAGLSDLLSSGWTQTDDASPGDVATAFSSGGSSAVGDETGKDQEVVGTDLLGSTVYDDRTPQWARIWRDFANIVGSTSVVGAAIAAYNHAVYTGVIPEHIIPMPTIRL